jgi:hypothetical protein
MLTASTIKKGNQMDNLAVKNKCNDIAIEAQKLWAATTELLIALEEREDNTHDTRAYLMLEEADSCFKNAKDYLDAASRCCEQATA